MESTMLTLVDGTSALAPRAQLEAELLKDRWDARNIPGLRYAPHLNNNYVNFTHVPEMFRPLVKDYIKFLLAAGRAAKTLDEGAYYLGKFFTFFLERHPGVCTLQDLREQDIDAFLLDQRATLNFRGKKTSDHQIWRSVHYVEGLLLYLERIESPMKPSQEVLRQLDGLIQHLALSCIPIVILLRASGWRISDVLYLKLDTCLEQEGNEKYSLKGMSLVLVQQWMAHASPEMTLIYAKILDETMRTQWRKTVQQGIVQFNDGNPEFIPGKKLLPMAGENVFDPERVREHRQNVKMALGSCLKTAKIVCKFVELPCFHCPAYVLTPDDLPALEAYEQQILDRIEIGKQAGNVHWIEVNQKNLAERVRPAIAMLKTGHIAAKNEKFEREYTDEEWEQRQRNQQEQAHE